MKLICFLAGMTFAVAVYGDHWLWWVASGLLLGAVALMESANEVS